MSDEERDEGLRPQDQTTPVAAAAPADGVTPADAGAPADAAASDEVDPADLAPSPTPGARGQARVIVVIVSVTVLVLVAIAVAGTAFSRDGSRQLSVQEVATKLAYLNGVTATTAYESLAGYPVTFLMDDDGNAVGTWSADGGQGDASVTTVDVTAEVVAAATTETTLDDDRFVVTGHGKDGSADGTVSVTVEERFHQQERELSATLDIEHVAQALRAYVPAGRPAALDVTTVRAVSIQNGAWGVLATATTQDGEELLVRAEVTGTNEAPIVTDYAVVR